MGLEGVLLATQLASTFMQVSGSIQQGQQQKEAEAHNAAVLRQQKEAVSRASELEIYQQRRQARALRAKQEALYGKAGVTLSGSPLAVIQDSMAQAELDMMITKYNAEVDMMSLENQARYKEYLGKTYQQQGWAKAGATLLGQSSDWLAKYSKMKLSKE